MCSFIYLLVSTEIDPARNQSHMFMNIIQLGIVDDSDSQSISSPVFADRHISGVDNHLVLWVVVANDFACLVGCRGPL